MLTTFAHAGHSHDEEVMGSMSAIDHCLPIILGAGVIVAILLGIIVYLLTTWQPKSVEKTPAKKTTKK